MTPFTTSVMTGRKVFWWIVGFFGVIVSVNFTMAAIALTTFNGVTSESAYVDGLAYNDQLREVERQRALGWAVETAIQARNERAIDIDATYLDQAQAPIGQLQVTAFFKRPTHEGFDFDASVPQTGQGQYSAKVEVPLAGLWDVQTVARRPGQEPYVLTYRVFVP